MNEYDTEYLDDLVDQEIIEAQEQIDKKIQECFEATQLEKIEILEHIALIAKDHIIKCNLMLDQIKRNEEKEDKGE